MTNKARLAAMEREADKAIPAMLARIRTHDQRLVWLWYAQDDLATDKNLPPSELGEIVTKRDRSAQAIAEKEAAEPGYFERVTAELKTLGVL